MARESGRTVGDSAARSRARIELSATVRLVSTIAAARHSGGGARGCRGAGSAVEVAARVDAEQRGERAVFVHAGLALGGIAAVALDRAVDAADRLSEAAGVDHRVV